MIDVRSIHIYWMNRRNLHFNSLRAFEAAARQRSLSRAAQELCVTHSAVSHQIKRLEQSLGVTLFNRSNRGVRLTGVGEALLPVLTDAFDRIENTLEGFTAAKHGDSLRVTTTPTFASKWLIPRLHRWHSLKPHQPIHLLPTLEMLDLGKGAADISIRCGVPPWPGMATELLLPIHMTPVCSPALLANGNALKAPGDVVNFSLVHADVGNHRLGEEWAAWFDAAGIDQALPADSVSLHDPWLAMQAAIDGLGVAIGYREFIADDVSAGRLVQPFDILARHAFSYYLVYPSKKRDSPEIKSFRQWILSETSDQTASSGVT